MFFLNELRNLKIYRKSFLLPINEKNKKKNSVAMLMTPSHKSSMELMKYELMSPKYFNSYYIERSAMYYINDNKTMVENESCLLQESSLDNIISDNRDKIVYRGYDSDVMRAMKVINIDYFNNIAKQFQVKLDYPIYVEVFRKKIIPEDTNDTLNVSSMGYYNSNLKNYDCYLKYRAIEFILNHLKEPLPKAIAYSICLYESGLYDIHRKDWIFGDTLRTTCDAISAYINKKGMNSFTKTIIKNRKFDAIYNVTIGTFILNDLNRIKTLFGLLESNDTDEYDNVVSEDEIIHIGPKCLMILQEDSSYNTIIKKLLYSDRYKNIKEVKDLYDIVKSDNPSIKYAYNSLDRYNSLNLFMDLSHYNESFIRNNTFKRVKGYNVFFELMSRLINDKRLEDNSYNIKTVMIPVYEWDNVDIDKKMWMIQESINPISCLYQTMTKSPGKLKEIFGDTIFLFMGVHGYFKLDFNSFNPSKDSSIFIRGIKALRDKKFIPEDDNDGVTASPKVITATIVDKIEKSQGVEINDISKSKKSDDDKIASDKDKSSTPVQNKSTSKSDEKSKAEKKQKDELVEKISKSAEINTDIDDVLDDLDKDDDLKKILANLSENPDNKSDISDARASRIVKLQNDIMDKEFKGKPLREILDTSEDPMEKPLPVKELNIDSVNEEWKELTFCNTLDVYEPDVDIVKIFNSFYDKSNPLSVISIDAKDISTSEDAIELYTVQYEDKNGKRFTIKLEVPKFIDNRYMNLRGNKKDISSQLFLMPIIKTAEDTVQVVSNYKKIFIKRYGTTPGKSVNSCGRLIKTLDNNKFENVTILEGDNSRICIRYELPIDYIDLASVYSKISTKNYDIYFNQDELRSKFKDKIELEQGLPFAYNKREKAILYYNTSDTFSYYLALLLSAEIKEFWGIYSKQPQSVRYTYSKASIMGEHIPLIVLCAYSEGLIKVLNKAGIKYRLEDNKRGLNYDIEDCIKFSDGYLIYDLDYASSLLMNGLKQCNTDKYSVAEINSKSMYLDFLEQFGGRGKSDGLDNFYNLMIDKPITYDTLKYYKLPTDYIEVLLYANRLLVDNKYAKHTQITDNRRIRRNEQIPAMVYGVLSTAYGEYCNDLKHGRNNPMSVKQSAVIDAVLTNSTTTDKSIINALNEYEAYNAVTPKGPSGMNSDRSFTLDKRSFDDSMFNVLGMSTGHASNVGISRQATIDANVSTARGYITNKNTDMSKLSVTKSLCMSEALTPYGTTRDDPARTAMTFIQTSKHGMRTKRSNPGLITTGADEALPYMISNIFAKKADQDGKVIDINENRMILEYKDGTHDYVNLEETVEKNSSSGFYVTLKLDTDMKVGKTFKKGAIVAYDKSSFSNEIGPSDNIAYDIGTIAKIAIINTDEGYEDSAIISEDLCEDMSSSVVLMCPNHPIVIPKETNVYNLVKKGQKIEEGDTLLTIQNPYDDEDVNNLLRNLVDDPEKISNLGRVAITSKVTGVVQDIIVYRTVDKDELSPSLKKIVNEYERGVNAKKKEMKQYGIEDHTQLPSTEKLQPTGKLKNAADSVVIEIYLKYEDKMKVGDKLVYYSALKGVIKDIFPEGQEPVSKYRPNEKIQSLLSVGSINGRMTTSILINGAIYKYLIELSRKCKDILGIKYKDNLFDK